MSRGQADVDNASVKIPLTILYHVRKPNPHSHVSHTPDFCPQCWESFFTLQSLRTQTVAVLAVCLACDISIRGCANFLPLLEHRTINLVVYRNTDLPSRNSGGNSTQWHWAQAGWSSWKPRSTCSLSFLASTHTLWAGGLPHATV